MATLFLYGMGGVEEWAQASVESGPLPARAGPKRHALDDTTSRSSSMEDLVTDRSRRGGENIVALFQ
jgi:hypothetical protein